MFNGSTTIKSIGITNTIINNELKDFIHTLQYATSPNTTRTPVMDYNITLDEYRELVSRFRKVIVSSPSNTHICHYVSVCENDGISQVHLTKLNLSLKYGYTLTR